LTSVLQLGPLSQFLAPTAYDFTPTPGTGEGSGRSPL
jgi:hypothetical protein